VKMLKCLVVVLAVEGLDVRHHYIQRAILGGHANSRTVCGCKKVSWKDSEDLLAFNPHRRKRSRAPIEASLSHGRLEQLDWVVGGIFDQNLLATNARHDIVSEVRSGPTKFPYFG